MKTLTIFFFIIISLNIYSQNIGDVVRNKEIANNIGGLGSTLTNGDLFGTAVASIGDINGDGVNDLAVGAIKYGTSGGVFILFMDTNGTVASKTILAQNTNGISGLTYNGSFGQAICSIGDINNDGIKDIAVSEVKSSDGGSGSGAIHIITLDSIGNATTQTKISATSGYLNGGLPIQSASSFGISLDTIGDLNNDGYMDLIVGNFADDQVGINKGAAWVLLLNQKKRVQSYYKIQEGVTNFNASIDPYDYYGTSCCAAGDMNNDGIKDILVGAFYDDDVYSDAGAFYIMHLDTNGSVKSYNKISNLSFPNSNPFLNGSNSAKSIIMIDDMDGNGTKEIVIGGYRYNNDEGEITTIFLDTNEAPISHNTISYPDIQTINIGSRFGTSLNYYGDFNNDGFQDIVVGSYYDNTHQGSIHIVSLYAPVLISKTNIQCYGDSTGMAVANATGANPPFSYLWSNGSTNDTISNLAAGTYSLTVTNSVNATTISNVFITQSPKIVLTTSNDTSIISNNPITISCFANGGTGNKILHWSNYLSGNNIHIVSPINNTTYSVWAMDDLNCISDTSYININIVMSVEDNNLSKSFFIYPNPAKDYIIISKQDKVKIKKIEIIDIMGAVIFEDKSNNRDLIKLNIEKLAKGNYFINIITLDGNKHIIKMIKI